MLASRGISLALAGGAACLSWGMWASADSPLEPVRGGKGRVTPVSATIPEDPVAGADAGPADIGPTDVTAQSPLDRLKARSAQERARRITGRRGAATAPLSADPVGQARAALPTPDDLRSRRDADTPTFPGQESTATTSAPTPDPSVPSPATATAPRENIAEKAASVVDENSVAELPLSGSARRLNESPLAAFEPVADDASPARTSSKSAATELPARESAIASPGAEPAAPATKPAKPAPVVTVFSPEEGAIPLEPREQPASEVVEDRTPDQGSSEVAQPDSDLPKASIPDAQIPDAQVAAPADNTAESATMLEGTALPEEGVNTPEPVVSEEVASPEANSGSRANGAADVEDEPLAALGSLPPHPEDAEAAGREPRQYPAPVPRTMGSRRASLRQADPEPPMADNQPDREPTRDPRELKGVKTIRPFKDYEPDEDILKADRCQNNCPRPNDGTCPDCKPGMSDDPNALSCPECPEEVALNSPEFKLAFPTRAFPSLDYRWEATNVWHYPLYFEDTELERYGHSRPFFVQPFVSAARFSGQFLLFPYRASLLPPWKRDYELGHYRPGRCVPYRYEVLPWNRSAAVWQAGVTTGAFFLFAPTP
jgi:hypothetical protein